MKVDINVSRTLTINTGNYESIRPSVSLTVKDVDNDKVSDVYLSLETALSGLLKMEILACKQEIDNKNSRGLVEYCNNVESNITQIGQLIEKHLIELDEN
jgi:hypothetical protein